jgi:HSP20 family molecular chaperone IbpA
MTTEAVTKQETAAPAETARLREGPVFAPGVDIKETETDVTLVADMPGVDAKSIHVDLDKNILTVRGTCVAETPEGCSLVYQEYRSGDYERAFTLGDQIDRASIKAEVKDGVLRLVLPKMKEVQPKRIAVKAG